jgi:hypothetical protein
MAKVTITADLTINGHRLTARQAKLAAEIIYILITVVLALALAGGAWLIVQLVARYGR